MADKGFMRLSDEELKWLDGRIGIIDLQAGCPVRCVICGVDSGRFGESMPLEDFLELSESIERVRTEKGIDVLYYGGHRDIIGKLLSRLESYRWFPFESSDPVYYPHIWEVIQDFYQRHNKKATFTTSGWKPGNNHMQKNMEQIVRDHIDGKRLTHLTYSVKTVGALVMKEYDHFLEALFGDVDGDHIVAHREEIRSHIQDFFESSRYARQVAENMRTLEGSKVQYDIQFVRWRQPKRLSLQVNAFPLEEIPEAAKKYEFLFSSECVCSLFKWARKKNNTSLLWPLNYFNRGFVGLGRAVTVLGLPQHREEKKKRTQLDCGKDPSHSIEIPDDEFTAMVTYDGALSLMWGQPEKLTTEPIPKEFLEARAERYSGKRWSKETRDRYRMLARLQGRNLLE